MRGISWTVLSVVAVMACCSAETQAQRSRGGGLGSNFARGPEVGKPLPDVNGYDADGKPFPLKKLKGSHAVIVFGCLT